MTLEVKWLREPEIVLITFSGKVTLEEVRQANEQMTQFVHSVPGSIHMILDVTRVTGFPFSVQSLQQAIVHHDVERLGWLIAVIHHQPLLEFICSTVIRLFALENRWRVLRTVEEAVKLIDQQAVAAHGTRNAQAKPNKQDHNGV